MTTWAIETYKGRCKTGWKIRQDRLTGMWEAYNRAHFDGPPAKFSSWSRAAAYVRASTYGQHDRASVSGGLRDFYKRIPPMKHTPKHRPGGLRSWDASWLLVPQRYIIGFDGTSDGDFAVCLGEFDPDEKGVRWTLSNVGWCESMGIPQEAMR